MHFFSSYAITKKINENEYLQKHPQAYPASSVLVHEAASSGSFDHEPENSVTMC